MYESHYGISVMADEHGRALRNQVRQCNQKKGRGPLISLLIVLSTSLFLGVRNNTELNDANYQG